MVPLTQPGSVVWHRGVPWLAEALTAATADGVADPVTEVAREFILVIDHDPGRARPSDLAWVERGEYSACVDANLVVVGHGRPEKALPVATETQPGPKGRKGGRGPRDYAELTAWLEDDGYQVVQPKGRNSHPYVINPQGARMVTLNHSPGDSKRSLANDVATCRRVLGVALRRAK